MEGEARCWWLTPIILATQEAEIRRMVRSQPRQIVHKPLSQKRIKSHHKKMAGGVAQGVAPEFKSQYRQKKKKKKKTNKNKEWRRDKGS
jgi:hypothetical protein